MNIQWSQLENEIVTTLQDLIRINTSNPPGGELEAARYIAKIAKENGLLSKVFETYPGRGNVIVYFDDFQKDNKPTLILLSHLDVVPASTEDWDIHPFEAAVKDGWIWGRGTVDTKHLTVMQLYSLILAKRMGIKINKNVILMATADEESGSNLGIVKMIEMFPDIFKNAEVISEGGGFPIIVDNRRLYLCETGQKGHCHIKFYFEKAMGNPFYIDNTLTAYSAELVQRLINFEWEYQVPETTLNLMHTIFDSLGIENYLDLSIPEKLNLLKQSMSPFMYKLIKAMTQNTFSSTIWKGGRMRRDSLFDSWIEVDCRILPGVTREMLENIIKNLCSDLPVRWEISKFSQGYESNCNSELFNIINNKIQDQVPNSIVVPFIATGGSDGRFLRDFNCKVFGFSPVLDDMTFEKVVPMVHGVNERISIRSLVFGTRILFESIKEYCQRGE